MIASVGVRTSDRVTEPSGGIVDPLTAAAPWEVAAVGAPNIGERSEKASQSEPALAHHTHGCTAPPRPPFRGRGGGVVMPARDKSQGWRCSELKT
jgi:hypothetical protein